MTIIQRSEWGARPANGRDAIDEAYGVAVHYEGVNLGAYDHGSCAGRVRKIQADHLDGRNSDRRPWADIAYSMVVCRHGAVYIGRGPGTRTAANGTTDANKHWYAVCVLMGPDDELTPDARAGASEAIVYLRANGRAGGQVKVHSDFKATACPGDKLRAWVRETGGREWGEKPVASMADSPGPLATDGQLGPATIKELQIMLNSTGANPRLAIDGDFGDKTKRALQARLNYTNGPVSIDGVIGTDTIKALQTHVGSPVDGAWGPATTQALQRSLNAGAF